MNIVIKNINEITPYDAASTLSRREKEKLVTRHLNKTKYTFHGFVDRSTDVVLSARYHNVRDRQGRFARTV